MRARALLVVASLAVGAFAPAAARAQASRTAASRRPASTVVRAKPRTVIVDAGHGGPDRGMTGTTSRGHIYEKDIVLDVAKKLAARLELAGVNVVMTRTTDTLIALDDRGRIANRQDGDLFISVHVNAANPHWKEPEAARGFETYFLAEAKTEDERRVAAMENEAERYDTNDSSVPSNDALGFMFNDMLQNEHLRESSDLAAAIQARLREAHPGPSRGIKQAGFRVLVTAFMPSVLVEVGFGTNRAEADWLASSAGQAQIADAISRAALDYLARFERRVSGGTTGGGK